MKKTFSLILAVIMIFGVMPIQVFAAQPVPVSAEFTDSMPISNQYVQNNWVDETGMVRLYDLGFGYEYISKVNFSNGGSLSADGYFNYEMLYCGVKEFYIYEFVNRDECQNAIDTGKTRVDVTVRVEIERLNGKVENYEFATQKEIVDAFVTDIRIVDTTPTSFNSDNINEVFKGKRFEIEFYDGKKETLTFAYDEKYECYYLGEIYTDFEYFEQEQNNEGITEYYKGARLYYLDAEMVVCREKLMSPFESITILGFNADKKSGIKDITYKITYKDGRTLEKTSTTDIDRDIDAFTVVDKVDNYDVKVRLWLYQNYSEITVSLGYEVWNIQDVLQGEAKDFCSCWCHEYGFKYVIGFFLVRIWQLLGINEVCKCGSWHW